MGISYAHYVIPRDQTVRPEPDQVAALIKAWIQNGYVVQPTGGQAGTGACFQTNPHFGGASKRAQPSKSSSVERWTRLFGKAKKVTFQDLWTPFAFPLAEASLTALHQSNVLIKWDGNPSATYPMQTPTQPMMEGDDRWPHELIIELSDDFFNPHTDPIGGSAKQVTPICKCGCHLEYEDTLGWLATEKIYRICPECGVAFRPQDHFAEIVNGVTGSKSSQMGGLCNRFAIIIDFRKDWPQPVQALENILPVEPKATSEFLNMCSAALNTDLNEFSYYC
jgi:hypothetical protein